MRKLTGRYRHRAYKPFLRKPLMVLQYQVTYTIRVSGSQTPNFVWIDAQEIYSGMEFEGVELDDR